MEYSKTKYIDLFVPGRLCLFGEHSDWAGRYRDINSEISIGKAIVTGIDLGIYATASVAEKLEVSSLNADGERVEFICDVEKDRLEAEAGNDGFFSYICGVAAYMLENYQVGGIRININKSTLPIKKGLSSSAAVCVLVARAFNQLYDLHISTNGEMKIAFSGELLTKSRCGRLDQACAYGQIPVSMEFDGERISVKMLKVGADLYWVFADLNAHKNTKRILSDLNRAYPFVNNEQELAVQTALGTDNIGIINRVIEAIKKGNAEELGVLMREAQWIFDSKIAPMCPEEFIAPKLHSVLADEIVYKYAYGGKGVGSQGDGTVQFIAKSKADQIALTNYLNSIGLSAFPFTISRSKEVKKAVVPIAGFASRLYPASRFIKKAFFPIIDENGIVKPVLMCILEELEEAGIEEIVLIVGEGESGEYLSLFKNKISTVLSTKLSDNVKEYEGTIEKIGKKIKITEQKDKRGLGHAVYQAKTIIGNEPFLLLLGDFIYRTSSTRSCTSQMLEAYSKCGERSLVSLKEIDISETNRYGCLTGKFDESDNEIMYVTDMEEKPSSEYAQEYLAIKHKGVDRYYATFGEYILNPSVFKYLEEDIKEHDEKCFNSEIELTKALIREKDNTGLTGVVINGVSFDVGIPELYYKTLISFHEFHKE